MTTAATISSKLTLDVSEYEEGIDKVVKGAQEFTEATDRGTESIRLNTDFMETATKASGDYAEKYAEIINLHYSGAATWEETSEKVGKLKEEFEVTGGSIEAFVKQEEEATKKSIGLSGGLGQLAKGFLGVATAYAAGRAVVKFVKDAMDAAAAAGKLGAEFDKNEKASKRLTLAIGVQLGRATKDAVGWFAELKNEMAENIEKGNEMAEMFELLGYSSQEIAEYYGRVRVGLDDAGESYANLIEQVEALNIAEESEMETAMRAARVAAERGAYLNAMGEAMGAMTEEAEEAANAFEGVETGITGMIESALRLVEWERAGGAEFAESFKEFWDAVVTGAITDESIIDAGLQMFEAAALGLEKKVGEIDWYSAAKRYQEQFGGTLRDANEEIMLNWGAMEVYLNDVDFDTIAQEIKSQLNMPLDEVTAHLFAIIAKMRAIDGMTSEATVIITTYEQTVTSFGQTGPVGQTGAIGLQHGGGFFAGQTMLVGEGGPELITAGVGGTVLPNEALDNSGVEERLESLEEAVLNMGEDMLAGISMLVG